MTPEVGAMLIVLLGTVIGVVGGYVLGFFQTRGERRDELRDKALAEIYGAMMRFYRGVVAWSSYHTGSPLTAPDISWEDYCRERIEEFADVYHINSIWLGRETDELINRFAQSGKDLINEFSRMAETGRLPDGTSAWDQRAQTLGSIQNEIREVLRAEIKASRAIFPYRIVVRNNVPEERAGE